MTLKELREKRSGLAAQMQALVTKAEDEKRLLADEEREQFDGFDTDLKALDEDISRRERVEDVSTRISAREGRKSDHDQPGREARVNIEVKEDRIPEIRTDSKFSNKEQAYRAGRWVQGNLLGDAQARQWCSDHGVEARANGSNSFTGGGALVPSELSNAIIRYRDTRGIFRRFADVFPMNEAVMMTAKGTGGLTAYPVIENNTASVTETTATFSQIELVAKEWGILTRMSRTIAEDSVINLAEYLAQEAGWAFSNAEDLAGFTGDGTSTHHGVRGLTTKINDGNHAGSIYTALTGNTAFSTLDMADLNGIIGKLPVWARDGAAWYISQSGYADSFERLMDAAGGATPHDYSKGYDAMFKGFPVIKTNVLNSTLSAQTSTVLALFGNLRLSSRLGDRRGFNAMVLNERYAELSQIGIYTTQRFDINNHELGNATDAGAMLALKTPAS